MNKNIAVVTTSRADWGHLEWPFRRMLESSSITPKLIVSGAHLDNRFGKSINLIQESGYEVTAEVPFLEDDDSDEGMARSIGRAVSGFSDLLGKMRPDILLLIADRYEMLAPASVALALRIPIAHIEGGEISEGAIDQQVRDALTKMSHIHFVPTEQAAKRVINMGEEKDRVYTVGTPSLDHLKYSKFTSLEGIQKTVGLIFNKKPIVAIFHPVTMHIKTTKEAEIFYPTIGKIAEETDRPLVFCFPNADAGYNHVIQLANRVCNQYKNAKLHINLNHLDYWTLMRESCLLIGNSSSGIMEAASLKLPVINVGIRQKGRMRAANVIDADANYKSIKEAVNKSLSNKFVNSIKDLVNPYGDGNSGDLITSVLENIELDRLHMKKIKK